MGWQDFLSPRAVQSQKMSVKNHSPSYVYLEWSLGWSWMIHVKDSLLPMGSLRGLWRVYLRIHWASNWGCREVRWLRMALSKDKALNDDMLIRAWWPRITHVKRNIFVIELLDGTVWLIDGLIDWLIEWIEWIELNWFDLNWFDCIMLKLYINTLISLLSLGHFSLRLMRFLVFSTPVFGLTRSLLTENTLFL